MILESLCRKTRSDTIFGLCYAPYRVTENERRCSEDMADRFCIYRVIGFAKKPRVYELRGAMSVTCSLEAVAWRARVVGE